MSAHQTYTCDVCGKQKMMQITGFWQRKRLTRRMDQRFTNGDTTMSMPIFFIFAANIARSFF